MMREASIRSAKYLLWRLGASCGLDPDLRGILSSWAALSANCYPTNGHLSEYDKID